MLPKFSYARPKSLKAASELLAGGSARVHAGGTDLIGCLRDEVLEVETVVSLSSIDGLSGIEGRGAGDLRIGGMTAVAEVAANAEVAKSYTALAEAAASVASPQLRNQGTVAGNLCQKPRCWYYRGGFDCLRRGGELCSAYGGDNRYHAIFGGDACYMVHPSDTAPVLVALQAVARIIGAGGTRSVAVEKLHVPAAVDPQRETVLEADEIITEIVLPKPEPGLVSSYRKVRVRGAWDFALAGVALAVVMDGERVGSARVVLSGVAATPWRAAAAEQAITGKKLDARTIAAAAEAAVEGAEALEHNAYKVDLVKGVVTDQLEALAS